jgi:hypothetical protein
MKKVKKQKTKKRNSRNTGKNVKIVRLYLCPNCRSANVKRIFAFRNIFGMRPMWKCQKCAYEAEVFPLLSLNINKLNKNQIKR